MPMTGLLKGATVTCLEVGFKETYIAAGFDDGTVNFYSMTSKNIPHPSFAMLVLHPYVYQQLFHPVIS